MNRLVLRKSIIAIGFLIREKHNTVKVGSTQKEEKEEKEYQMTHEKQKYTRIIEINQQVEVLFTMINASGFKLQHCRKVSTAAGS